MNPTKSKKLFFERSWIPEMPVDPAKRADLNLAWYASQGTGDEHDVSGATGGWSIPCIGVEGDQEHETGLNMSGHSFFGN